MHLCFYDYLSASVTRLCREYKLGYGVNASAPSHPKTPEAVRYILPAQANVEDAKKDENRREEYTRSTISTSGTLKGSIAVPTVPLKFSVEGQLCRDRTKVMITKGT